MIFVSLNLIKESKMNDKDILKKFYNLKNDIDKKKIEFINNNDDVNNYLKELSSTSIRLAKMRLNNKSEINLENKMNSLINDSDLYNKSNSIKYRCDICKDKGIVNGKTCKCFENLVKYEKYEDLCKDLPLSELTFKNFDLSFYSDIDIPVGSKYSERDSMKRMVDFCKKYAREFDLHSKSLIITGETGLGKTHISAAISNVLIRKNINVMYFSTPNLIQKMDREKFGKIYEMEDILKCDFLVLDDLGTEFKSEFSKSIVYNIINIRTMKKIPTMINTNLSINELACIYENRIASRIMGNFVHMHFIGKDIRQKIGVKMNMCLRNELNRNVRGDAKCYHLRDILEEE